MFGSQIQKLQVSVWQAQTLKPEHREQLTTHLSALAEDCKSVERENFERVVVSYLLAFNLKSMMAKGELSDEDMAEWTQLFEHRSEHKAIPLYLKLAPKRQWFLA
jgi:hypothetical protein